MSKNRIYFKHSPKPTIWVEVELYTVSKKDYNLFPGSPAILNNYIDDTHVKEELLECIIEINTGICEDIVTVRSDLINKIDDVQQKINDNDMGLVSIGTHPFAN